MNVIKAVDVEFANDFTVTVDDIIKVLNVERQSAKEMLSGEIPMEEMEIHKLAEAKGLTLKDLLVY